MAGPSAVTSNISNVHQPQPKNQEPNIAQPAAVKAETNEKTSVIFRNFYIFKFWDIISYYFCIRRISQQTDRRLQLEVFPVLWLVRETMTMKTVTLVRCNQQQRLNDLLPDQSKNRFIYINNSLTLSNNSCH